MFAEKFQSQLDSFELESLYSKLESNSEELVNFFLQVLRRNQFTNRTGIRPKDLVAIARMVRDGLLNFFEDQTHDVRKIGEELSKIGLSGQSIFDLGFVIWVFNYEILEADRAVIQLCGFFVYEMINGFYDAREKNILVGQESFRIAFQNALDRSMKEAEDSRKIAQETLELNYRNILYAQEEERRIISRDLHDEAGQSLIGIRMSLTSLLTDQTEEISAKKQRLENAIELVDKTLEGIRNLAHSLRPPVLALLGINKALRQLCLEFNHQTGLRIDYLGKELPGLSDEISISLYRCVQESLSNIIKHSGATQAWIKLGYENGKIELSIKDNGRGLDVGNKSEGLGLAGMKERIRLLNGSMQIKSVKGRFSQISISLPWLQFVAGNKEIEQYF